ncbi:unnamed protein product [Nippostrongylus brasiliensis]|uniref:Large ribosomal subunit protein uL23m n=1 Tax=Nippostrongylus brasiliensis TaxID=27835 RepID=A0A0N4XTA0_NIPBR|nr:hypothetical protein Q1695_001649 [Nippostrongylus brasiliensis]VDL69399.1 unnamed protein product [Nippostrongylus brasiliensis]
MCSRLPRLWFQGAAQNRTLFPDFPLVLISNSDVGRNKLPGNCVKFEVDVRMTRHEIREYLTKIYNLPVRSVRTEVRMGDISWSTPLDEQYKKAMWKEKDKKIAYVFMSKDFDFVRPNLFEADDEEQELQKAKDYREKTNLNSNFVNRDRKKIGDFYGV